MSERLTPWAASYPSSSGAPRKIDRNPIKTHEVDNLSFGNG
jgi:hypothetical protein